MPSTPAHPDTMETTPQRSFVRSILPWIVAAVMLLVYLVTLDTVVTVQSVYPLARATGLDWHATYIQPLTWLVGLPVRVLPAGVQLLALNFIAALCAALSLALLARCVALLPHDRTQLQRDKLSGENSFLNLRLAWVPVVFAVLVCGFQRTFWEHAVINTGEALDLLLFAYCVRCLLEFRIDERNAWLNKLALVYGIAITNNFAMLAFFPALLVALVWIKGLRFFRFDFLARMFLFGLAGLSLYLLLPLVQPQSEMQPVTFWQALKTNLAIQKQFIMGFPRWRAGWIGLYALLPLLLAGIRWPSSFGDTSPVGSTFTNIFGVILHAGLLGFGLYIAFDPAASPRAFGRGLAYLPCYFLAALGIGYYSGFLLLVFSGGDGRSRRRSPIPPAANVAVTALVCGAALAVSGWLLVRNYPKIREATSPVLHDYANGLAKSLPDQPAIVLSDDPLRLYALAAVLGREAAGKHLLLDTPSLANPTYHAALRRRYGDRWPKLELEKGYIGFTPQQITETLEKLGANRELVYLHPSFGYYFEKFYLEPRQMAYTLKPYAKGAAEPPVPAPALIDAQAQVWNALVTGPGQEIKAWIARSTVNSGPREATSSTHVGAAYSRALNWWGVELQRAGRFDEAAKFFSEALALYPDNAAALINLDGNTIWRKERKPLPVLSKVAEEKLNLYQGVDQLLGVCGPVDVPDFSLEMAQLFLRLGFYRQSGQMVRRALAYSPGNLVYETALANIALLSGDADEALSIVARIRPLAKAATPALQIEIERIAAFAQYAKKNLPAAEKLLEANLKEFPNEDAGYNVLSQLYVTHSVSLRASDPSAAGTYLTNAVKVIEGQVQAQPLNPSARFNLGALDMFTGDHARAVTGFTKVLEMQKDNSAALLNRAMTYLQSKKNDEAKRDYQAMLARHTTTDFRVYWGLGDIAYQQQDWKAAKDHYTQYLKYAPANSGEAQTVRERLDEIKKK